MSCHRCFILHKFSLLDSEIKRDSLHRFVVNPQGRDLGGWGHPSGGEGYMDQWKLGW